MLVPPISSIFAAWTASCTCQSSAWTPWFCDCCLSTAEESWEDLLRLSVFFMWPWCPSKTLQDCFHQWQDPIKRSREDLPKDLLSQLILKSPPASVVLRVKRPKPGLVSCKSNYGSFSCEFTFCKGQRNPVGALITPQCVKDKFSFLTSVSQGQSFVTSEVWSHLGAKKNLYPRLLFTKSHQKIKCTLNLPLPPVFSSLLPQESLHATSSYASLTNTLHWIFGFFHIWVGRFSLPFVSRSTGNTLNPSQGRKLALHASPCNSQGEMYVFITAAQLSFSFLFSSPFKELIEVDSEVVFELAAYILQVSTHLLSLGASSCCNKSFDLPNPQWLCGSVGVPPSCRKKDVFAQFSLFLPEWV